MTATTSATATAPPRVATGPALLALATGGFAIGTTEFVTMGLLPRIAAGVDVSIPSAGHLISAYALGVVIGAPLLAVAGARLPRRGLLVALMTAYAALNLLSAAAPSYEVLVAARFLDGLPHGVYFGVASLVAASLVPPDRRGRAVASVMLGLSVANVVGVPAATWLGQQLGWRSAYVATALIALAAALMVLAFVPSVVGDRGATGRRELRAFRSRQVWLTLLAGSVGFGGMFAVYSYIAPTVTDVSGLVESRVPVFLFVFGVGMVVGTALAGRLADWSVFGSLALGAVGSVATMLLAWLAAPYGWALLPVVFGITLFGSFLVLGLQLRLMTVAGDAVTLGAAMNHASLNVANALGAWLGGVVIAAGYGYRSTALVGAGLAVLGVLLVAWSYAVHRSDLRRGADAGAVRPQPEPERAQA